MGYALEVLVAVILSTAASCHPLETSTKIENIKKPTPIETVTAFCAAIPEDNSRIAIRRWFTPKTAWTNEGISSTTGIEEAIAFIERNRSPSVAAVHFDILAVTADGNRVLTERLDRFVRSDGSEIAAFKVMGIFEVDGDHIVAWRDYFDVNVTKKLSDDKH